MLKTQASTKKKKKEKKKRGAKTWSNFKNINSKTPEKLSLATNYNKLSLITFTTCGQTLTKILKTKIGVKFWILLLLLQMSYIFIASTKDLNVLQISTEN